ncbi:MAG TPA: hypothetical protein DCE41_01535 [Cytophagales bacterium]|nr:hypothetical protein [Cytophagales bacterium]HAA20003.1 hypothetical protein [Cytophagales bacterium]HAP64671.1 hypothetical protein [Cytophagales bacterium]
MPQFGLAPYQQGISHMTYEYQREFPDIKTTDYLQCFLLQHKLDKCGAREALYHSTGQVSECTHCTVLAVKVGKVITPAKGILFRVPVNWS